MSIINTLNTRYSTKKFDSTKKVTDEQIAQIEDLLQLSPSSVNLQPWHFVIATTEEGKKRIAKSALPTNEPKVLDASISVVFASKIDLTEEYINHVLDQEAKDGRLPDADSREQQYNVKKTFSYMHKLDLKDFQHWTDKQIHLNLGNFLLGVAELGLDAVPMEGLDFKVLDAELGLREKGFSSSIVVSIGYRSSEDFNKDLPKSRLPKSEIIEKI